MTVKAAGSRFLAKGRSSQSVPGGPVEVEDEARSFGLLEGVHDAQKAQEGRTQPSRGAREVYGDRSGAVARPERAQGLKRPRTYHTNPFLQ